ncbi:hypothetical protein StoSoilA2_33740 [Arthrobacter sp. StoSoilA2]|nr:hypothetical protein StoSoilA2_33740 [Arthrobacter sp. StoSoilA2]
MLILPPTVIAVGELKPATLIRTVLVEIWVHVSVNPTGVVGVGVGVDVGVGVETAARTVMVAVELCSHNPKADVPPMPTNTVRQKRPTAQALAEGPVPCFTQTAFPFARSVLPGTW